MTTFSVCYDVTYKQFCCKTVFLFKLANYNHSLFLVFEVKCRNSVMFMLIDLFHVDLNSIHSKTIFDQLLRESGPVCAVTIRTAPPLLKRALPDSTSCHLAAMSFCPELQVSLQIPMKRWQESDAPLSPQWGPIVFREARFALDLGTPSCSRGPLAPHLGPHVAPAAPCRHRAPLALDLGP